MKILHLALQAPYNEGWGYQENLLTKYQAKLGHDVILVTSCFKNSSNSTLEKCDPEDYVSPDNFRVIRLEYKKFFPTFFSSRIKYYKIYNLLCDLNPEFIMVHGLSNLSVIQVKKYVKHYNPNCIVIADNHLDYNIGAGLIAKGFFRKAYVFLLKILNSSMQKIYKKVYGVTPWRAEFANDVFGIKSAKLDVLPAGADDEKIDYKHKETIRKNIREKYGIKESDFLIVTGGKIDIKKNIHTLMSAVAEFKNENVKLLVFGVPSDDVSAIFDELSKNNNIICVGWIPSDETYNYFFAADLMFFPGQHSVMWEQVVSCGTPIVMKHYHAMRHCDIGGNAKFLYDDSKEGIICLLKDILKNDTYQKMLESAHSDARKAFLYSELAKKSIEAIKEN